MLTDFDPQSFAGENDTPSSQSPEAPPAVLNLLLLLREGDAPKSVANEEALARESTLRKSTNNQFFGTKLALSNHGPVPSVHSREVIGRCLSIAARQYECVGYIHERDENLRKIKWLREMQEEAVGKP